MKNGRITQEEALRGVPLPPSGNGSYYVLEDGTLMPCEPVSNKEFNYNFYDEEFKEVFY